MPRIIHVQGFPLVPTYDTPEAAVAGAMNHPRQPQARANTQRLRSSQLIDAAWNDTNFCLSFSNANILQVFIDEEQVDWRVSNDVDLPADLERVGAEPLNLDWGGVLGRCPMDRSALIASRRGADFQQLFVNEMGLLLYLRGHNVLWFGRMRDVETKATLLYVSGVE